MPAPDRTPDQSPVRVPDWLLTLWPIASPILSGTINTLVSAGKFHIPSNTHLLQSCLDAAKEARLRESQRPAHPGPDFSSQLDVSTVSSARATMPSV